MADLCTHVHHHRADERTSPPPLFSRLQFNTQIGSRDNATGPRKQPLSLPLSTHTHTRAYTHRETGHTPRGGNRGGATEGEISKRKKDSGARIDPFPPIESLIPFQKPTPLLPLCDDERNNRAEKCALPSIVLFCRKVFQCFFSRWIFKRFVVSTN